MKKIVTWIFFGALISNAAWAETSSFAQLMAQGESVTCSFQKKDGSESGTVYVSGGLFRGDFQVRDGGTEFPMHMIRKDQKMYTWGGPMGEKQGMIMPVLEGKGMGMMNQGPAARMDEEMDFTCQDWRADSGAFEPPADVQFQDMAQIMGAYAGAGQ